MNTGSTLKNFSGFQRLDEHTFKHNVLDVFEVLWYLHWDDFFHVRLYVFVTHKYKCVYTCWFQCHKLAIDSIVCPCKPIVMRVSIYPLVFKYCQMGFQAGCLTYCEFWNVFPSNASSKVQAFLHLWFMNNSREFEYYYYQNLSHDE